ncbi:MAG: CspA family cold shock protein, partial [Haloarculaceae archaeon]
MAAKQVWDCGVTGRGTSTLGRVIPRWPLHLVVMANGKVDFFNDTGGYGFI